MKTFLATFIILVMTISADAQRDNYYNTKGLAINGYDAVSYFKENKAMKGADSYSIDWQGCKWNFSSRAYADSFAANPARFAPQFGGYCAYGVSENHKAPTDPTAWTIVNDKLYLNYNSKVKEYWIKDTAKLINVAKKNWLTLSKEN